MRKAIVLVNGIDAGVLEAFDNGRYQFIYDDHCIGLNLHALGASAPHPHVLVE
jgi:hypothetical protein